MKLTKTIKQFAIVLSMMVVGLTFFNLGGIAFAGNTLQKPMESIDGVAQGSLRDTIVLMLNYFLGFLGFIATVFIVYAGVLYTTSNGNDDQVGKAKTIITNALIGIVIIALAAVLVNFVIDAAGGGPAA